jgi:uridine kinase
MKPARLILIAGPSCSGKSTLASSLTQQLSHHRAVQLSLDNYYRDLSHLPAIERAQQNFDHPEAWEHERILNDLAQLKARASINMPIYDFHSHSRSPDTHHITGANYIIAEGIFALCYQALNSLADYRIFVDLDDATALQRRIERDHLARGRSKASITQQFNTHVVPATHSHIKPSERLDAFTYSEASNYRERNHR